VCAHHYTPNCNSSLRNSGLENSQVVNLASELRDFSIFLTSELIKLLGNPYQSSISTVRRFSDKDFRIYVDYERERDEVDLEGIVATGGLTLGLSDAVAFLDEIQREVPLCESFRIFRVGNALTVFPRIEIDIPLGPKAPDKQRTSAVAKWVKTLLSDLGKIQFIIRKFTPREIGFSEIASLWTKARIESIPAKKGKLLEELFLQLIAIDGNLVLVNHNVRTQSEEIDIVLEPHMSSPFWSRIAPPMILLECKNWKNKVSAKEVRNFAGKIENRPKMLCRIGFLIATNGFTKDAQKELLGYRARDFIIATVTGVDITKLIHTKSRLSNILEKRLVKAGFS